MALEAKVSFDWKGDQWEKALDRSSVERMGIACLELEKDIKRNFGVGEAPGVVTGRLRSSITSNWTSSGKAKAKIMGTWDRRTQEQKFWGGDVGEGVDNPGGKWPVIRGVVGTKVKYAYELEMGTGRKSRPFPFLRPALERNRKSIIRLFQKL